MPTRLTCYDCIHVDIPDGELDGRCAAQPADIISKEGYEICELFSPRSTKTMGPKPQGYTTCKEASIYGRSCYHCKHVMATVYGFVCVTHRAAVRASDRCEHFMVSMDQIDDSP